MRTALYLIPGIGCDARMYRLLECALAEDIRCISWNLPGYGAAAPMTDYGFGQLAGLLHADMVARSLKQVHVLGHSIGGMVAQEFALRFPEMTQSIILSATTSNFGSRDGTFQEQFLKARLEPLDEGRSLADLAPEAIDKLAGDRIAPENRSLAIEAMGAVPEDAYREAINCLVTFDRREDFEKIACPVLLIAGDRDENAPAKTMQRMAESLAHARLTVLEGVGHLAPLEAPEAFAGAVRTFLEGLHE